MRRLNAVASSGEVAVEAWFSREGYGDRSWAVRRAEWGFKSRIVGHGSGLSSLPLRELITEPPDLFVQGYDRWFFAAGFLAARAAARRTAFRVLPNYDLVSERTWWRELSKHFLFRSVDCAKVSGLEAAAMAEEYGLPQERAFPVAQSSDLALFETARAVDPIVRDRDRLVHGLEGCVFLYVGRLLPVKGVDYLIDAFERVRAAVSDVSLLLVGDGADQARYAERLAEIPHAQLAGFVHESDLPRYYAMADVFVFPTLGDAYGLAVDEALAAGLPVVSTASAGDIRARLEATGAGRVVRAADVDELTGPMLELARNSELRQTMARRTWDAVSEKTDERYARDFIRFVFATLESRRRPGIACGVGTVAGRILLTAARASARKHRSARAKL
jgi:glycosyltransferase involved in cell wall biosynthesis